MSDKTAVKYVVKKIIEFYANVVLMLCLSFALCSPINRQRPFWRRRAVGADLYWLGAQSQMFFASVCVSKFLRCGNSYPANGLGSHNATGPVSERQQALCVRDRKAWSLRTVPVSVSAFLIEINTQARGCHGKAGLPRILICGPLRLGNWLCT